MNNLLPLWLLCATLLLSGCLAPGGASAPTHFYRLEYAPDTNSVTSESAKSPTKILVRVGTSGLLRGPRMLMAPSDYRLAYAEGERWAEPLPAAFTRMITVGLRQHYATVEGVPVSGDYLPDYRVSVTLERLWGTPQGDVVLEASWQITDAKHHQVASGSQVWRTGGWKTGDYEQMARKVSGLVPALVEALRASLSPLDAPQKNL